jgi:DNA-binding XRE family transcriptional regulator
MKSLKLKSIRVGAGECQKETALALGMYTPQYCNKENGKTPFTLEEIARIAKHFNLEPQVVDEIFFDGKLTNRIIDEQSAAKETA